MFLAQNDERVLRFKNTTKTEQSNKKKKRPKDDIGNLISLIEGFRSLAVKPFYI